MSVTYKQDDGVALITLDDGKVNALSTEAFALINEVHDRAPKDHAVTIMTSREGICFAGFDLNELAQSPYSALAILRAGASLCLRLLAFPCSVITACNGHEYPMGGFILMSADYRIGVDGPYGLGMDEVRINMTVPKFAIEVARGRLAPAHFNRTAITGELFSPEVAMAAGILDEVVDAASLIDRARVQAEEFKQIDFSHHHATKLKVHSQLMQNIEAAAEEELTIENTRAILEQ